MDLIHKVLNELGRKLEDHFIEVLKEKQGKHAGSLAVRRKKMEKRKRYSLLSRGPKKQASSEKEVCKKLCAWRVDHPEGGHVSLSI